LPSREEVGSKAFNLMRMAQLGLPIPPGFVIGTQFCHDYLEGSRNLSSSLTTIVEEKVEELQNATDLSFGGQRRPLLVSVRSGAAVSMPGMMDTLLNIGLNNDTVSGLVRMTGNPRFVWDSYRRLVQTYAGVVHDCPAGPFEEVLEELLRAEELDEARDLDSQELARLSRNYLEIFEEQTGNPFPQNPMHQLIGAVEAVFRSWESPRAREYRRVHDIRGLAGTAVTVQAMVFGNMGATSGSGVGFTRDPVTGDRSLYMDFLFNAQGEDIVSGRQQINQVDKLAYLLPGIFGKIQVVSRSLELEFRDMQDFEFTVQEGKLYVLQCRTGKRTPWAALKIAVDLVNEGLIDRQTALKRLQGYDLSAVRHTKLTPVDVKPLASGLVANRGVATGEIAFDSETIPEKAKAGKSVILVRDDTSTSDIAGIVASAGILTRLGGRTSHAAVVARQMDKVCIVGCRQLSIDVKKKACLLGGKMLSEGDYLSLDGNSGNIYFGAFDIVVEKPTALLAELEKWKHDE
jgi:pyruvate,orthophosphate dikinase